MRYLGLDYGSKTCGVAISDTTGMISSSLKVLRYSNIENLLDEIEEIIKEKKVNIIVLGNPLNLNGSMSTRSKETLKFKELLENRFNLEVKMQDERLSTTEAEKILIKNGSSRNKRKQIIDKMAATIILQSYLDRK